MVGLKDREIEASAVLRHRQMDPVLVDLLPLRRQCFGPPKPGEEKKLVGDPMDRVRRGFYGPAPSLKILNDFAVLSLVVPHDRLSGAFWKIMDSPRVVPDDAEVLQRMIVRRGRYRHRLVLFHHRRLGNLIKRQPHPVPEVPIKLVANARPVGL